MHIQRTNQMTNPNGEDRVHVQRGQSYVEKLCACALQ